MPLGWTVALLVVVLCQVCACGASSAPANPPSRQTLPPAWRVRTIATVPAGFGGARILPGTALALGIVPEPVPPPTAWTAYAHLYQVDLRTGAGREGSLVFASGALVALGRLFAYIQPRTETVRATGTVDLKARSDRLSEIGFLRWRTPTLEPARNFPIASEAGQVPAVADFSPSVSSTWVGRTGRVELVDALTGAVLRSIALPEVDGAFRVAIAG